jgi:CDP-6-deoxy-D-xylo-4-hexulose-3-dehydrase
VHDLYLIEDNCDALGSRYAFAGQAAQATGTFGDLSTQSFYPPHHMTMGEGGAVNIGRDMRFKVIVESFRDWGRDCWCGSGVDNTCGKRFGWQLGDLPEGYDHKYIYSHLGYNLKPLDPQAAIGRVQLRRLSSFIQARKDNWETLRRGLQGLEPLLDFSLPTHATAWLPPQEGADAASLDSNFTWDDTGCRTDCSWFGFKITVKPGAPFTRTQLAAHLDEHKIGNRMLFGGNLVRQPAFVQLKYDQPEAYRVVGSLAGADHIMHHTLFLGTYPGLTQEMLAYEIKVIRDFAASCAA